MPGTGSTHNAAVDASVLINLTNAGSLGLLGRIESWDFSIPDEVVEEIIRAEQAAVLESAFEAGQMRRVSSTDPAEIALYAELRQRMGKGEAACLAIAAYRGWMLVSDDRGRAFRRLVRERIGEERLVGTPEIVRVARTAGVLSQKDADHILEVSRE